MAVVSQPRALRAQLEHRYRRLQDLARDAPAPGADLVALIRDAEAAIRRLDAGSYGICEQCHDPIEPDYLRAYPTVSVCLSHLSDIEQRRIERDLELAARVQAQLLPPRDLALGSYGFAYDYEPVGPVSGDYCDVLKHADASVYVFVGDVTGKGVSASLLMTQLHAIFRSLISLNLPVNDLVQRANGIFAESTLSTHFATLVCAHLSLDGAVTLVNAGHCPPVRLHAAHPATFGPNGFPLGLVNDTTYTVTTTHLDPGDSLIVYTDGLTEGINAAQEEFGESRVLAALQQPSSVDPASMIAACRRGFLEFIGGEPRVDDLTMLAIQRRNRG